MTKLVLGLGGAGLATLGTALAIALGGSASPAAAVSTFRGPCDEPEHRNDPRCAAVSGTTTTATTATTTTKTATTARTRTATGREQRRPGEDVRGPCEEIEHRNDPRCTGAAATRADRSGPRVKEADDDGDHRGRGRGRGGDDRRGSNSGRG